MIEFTVAPSPDGMPNRTNIIEQLDENELAAILNATQVVNEVQLNTNGLPVNGVLSLQSKARYSLEIGDF